MMDECLILSDSSDDAALTARRHGEQEIGRSVLCQVLPDPAGVLQLAGVAATRVIHALSSQKAATATAMISSPRQMAQ